MSGSCVSKKDDWQRGTKERATSHRNSSRRDTKIWWKKHIMVFSNTIFRPLGGECSPRKRNSSECFLNKAPFVFCLFVFLSKGRPYLYKVENTVHSAQMLIIRLLRVNKSAFIMTGCHSHFDIK